MMIKKFYRIIGLSLCSACLGWLLVLTAVAQTPPAPAQSPGETPAAAQGQSNEGEGARATQANTTQSNTTQATVTQEQKISPQEAEALFREVDEILKFASKDTNLPIKHEVKRRLTSRDELAAYMNKHMSDDEDAKRLQRSELVLKRFGLLPPDFDLGKFLVALLREQVAGYYDPKTKTVNLLDWLGLEQQRPVLAHELTHALQDQSFGLEKWMKAGAGDLAERRKEPTPADIENDEISSARQAVVEGQAMVVLLDYMLAPTGRSLLTAPEVVSALKESMLGGTADSPIFNGAPIFIKDELTFPYRYGLDFEAALLAAAGKDRAYAGALANPPYSTRQIMEPKTYLSGERIEPLHLPDFKQDFKNYERFDIGAMGEFDVAVLIDEYAGSEASHKLYPHWRGGYYYAARPKGNLAAPLGLLYVSRWSDAEKAAAFAGIYAKSLAKRYPHAHEVAEEGTSATDDLQNIDHLNGKHTWRSEQGDIVIDVQGVDVMITESLDQSTTEHLEQELFQPTIMVGK